MNRVTRQAWTVSLDSLLLPVRVEHEKLRQDERVDELSSRLDFLSLSTSLTYAHQGPTQRRGFDGLWAFSEFFSRLPIHEVSAAQGPLEELIDKTLEVMLETAQEQEVSPIHALVQAQRKGLIIGAPVLSSERVFGEHWGHEWGFPGIYRSAGIDSTPLQVVVDHSWCDSKLRVEHKDRRPETLEVSFHALSRAKDISGHALEGLYNYAGLMNTLENLQGMVLEDAIESLCERLTLKMVEDAREQGVDLMRTEVVVKRKGYVRVQTSHRLMSWFS